MYETLHFEVDEKKIGVLTLDVPGKLNAHTKKMRQELLHFWIARQNAEEECRVIIMTGAGRAFCSGSDVDEMDDESRPFHKQNIEEIYAFQSQLADVILMMRRAPQPIIGAIRGWAAGGGFSFALATDIRIVDPTAKFAASYINVGLTGADMGGSFHFPRQVNLGFAAEYLYTGEPIDAEMAYRIGLANYLVPPEQLLPKARELAEKMVTKSVLGLRMTKEVLNQNIGVASLESALHLENRNQVLCMGTRPITNPLKKKDK
jgi:enoyl-CoA hydratase